jgi:S-formylglutathione hydrolase FrmB
VGPGIARANALTLVSSARLDPRLVQLTFRTPALKGPTGVRVLLPSTYQSELARRYPVLYLLHGTSGDDTDWTTRGNAETYHIEQLLPWIGRNFRTIPARRGRALAGLSMGGRTADRAVVRIGR